MSSRDCKTLLRSYEGFLKRVMGYRIFERKINVNGKFRSDRMGYRLGESLKGYGIFGPKINSMWNTDPSRLFPLPRRGCGRDG